MVYYLSTCHDIATLRKVRSTKTVMRVLVEIVICILLLIVSLCLVGAARLLLVHWASAVLRGIDTHLILHHVSQLTALGRVLVTRYSAESFRLLCWSYTSLSLSCVMTTTRRQGLLLETLVVGIML